MQKILLCCLLLTAALLTKVHGQTPDFSPQPSLDLSKFKRVKIDSLKGSEKIQRMSLSGTGSGAGPKGVADATLPPVIMPGPNSATLTRLVSESVDLYTGKLNLEVPLYDLKGRALELPISLQGNVNSHKTNEYAGPTGLGWHLNAGGMITRVMKSLPDEFTGVINSSHYNYQGYGYIKLKQSVNVDISLFESGTYDINKQRDIIERGNWNVSQNQPQSGYDLQPDEFYFNFGKYSGKFMFDQDGKIHLISKSNLVIDPSYEVRDGNNKITTFIITTDDGTKYTFGTYPRNAVEETKMSLYSENIRYFYSAIQDAGGVYVDAVTGQYVYERYPYVFSTIQPPGTIALDDFTNGNNKETKELFFYPSTWHLAYITSPSNEQILFNYADNGTISYLADRSFSASIVNLEEAVPAGQPNATYFRSNVAPVQTVGWWRYHYPSPHFFSVTKNTVSVTSKKLQSIVTAQGHSVTMYYNTPREDFPSDKRLDKIVVKNSDNLIIKEFSLNYEIKSSTEPIETFKFSFNRPNYDYTGGTFNGVTWGYSSQNYTFDVPAYCRKRMFLKSIQESANGITIPPTTFEYNTTSLPFVTSTEQDRFGFANSNPARHPFSSLSYQYVLNGQTKTVPSTSIHPVLYFQVTNSGANFPWPRPSHQGYKEYTLDKLKAGVLTQITYPTGGYKTFEFEYNGDTWTWNGIRPTFIKEYASPAATPVTKEYSYGTFRASDGTVHKYEMTENIPTANYVDSRVFFASSRVNPDNLTKGAAGGYDYAEIKQPGNGKYRIEFTNYSMTGFEDAANPIKIISSYVTPSPKDIGYNVFPFPAHNNFEWKRGLPLFEKYYNEGGTTPIKTVEYAYDYTSFNEAQQAIPGLTVTKARLNFQTGGWNCFLYGKTTYYPNWLTQSSRTVTTIGSTSSLSNVQKEEYTYRKATFNGIDMLFIDQTKEHKYDKNEQLITKYKYWFDFPFTNASDPWQTGFLKLGLEKVYNTVIEKYQYLQNSDGTNKRYVAGALNKYHSTKPLVLQTFAFQPAGTLSTYTEASTSGGTFSFDSRYKSVANFPKYLSSGAIVERSKESDVLESYIYDYSSTYPVAKIENASVDDVAYTSFETDALGGWTMNPGSAIISNGGVTGKRTFSGVLLRTINNPGKYIVTGWGYRYGTQTLNGAQGEVLTTKGPWALKQWKLDISAPTSLNLSVDNMDEVRLYPEKAHLTTYTYAPLVGMTSQCDPGSHIVTYEYDGLQRLKLIKDEDGNVIKTYEYNYRVNNTNPRWVTTSERRCKPCELNPTYNTTVQQVKQVDVNPESSTYNNLRWLDLGENGACTIQPAWQIISGPTCLTNSSGQQTGVQRTVEKDMNPCSASYNTTRNIDNINYAACPSTVPDWQPLEEYRCRPCPANSAYESNIRERKWKDQNPSSNSYQQTEWRPTGTYCNVPPAWQNTSTAPRCQMDQYGLPTGYLEQEQRDINPCSPTYNTYQWVQTVQSTDCQPVYMELSFENVWYGYITYADVVIHFYHDPGHTIEAYVSNVPITLIKYQHRDCYSSITTTYNFNCYGPVMTLLNSTELYYEETPGCPTYFDYYIQ